MDIHSIAGYGLQAKLKNHGAELCSLIGADGIEVIWQAHAAWPRHAPVLFPIVGTLKNNRYRHQGRWYAMGRHGFARDIRFELVGQDATSCRFALTDDANTWANYPFTFRFEVAYAMTAAGLEITYAVSNTCDVVLPASFGAHPAFNWPLVPGVAKTAHRLVFEQAEPAPIRRITPDGLLRPESLPTPIEGSVLNLRDDLFVEDAVILDRPASRSVRYGAPGTPTVEVLWEGFRELGIWTRPGVDLLCIEPWHGMSSPAGFDGEFIDKPGLMLLAPGERRAAMHRIRVIPSGEKR
jgi:galactose mutarotase-like enzyme